MGPIRVNQISKTSLFHIHLPQVKYQINGKTQTHMAKHTELFYVIHF